jgi:hypothetical protein
VYRVLLQSLIEDAGTDGYLRFMIGTAGDYLVKTEIENRVSCSSGNIISISAMISFLRRVSLEGVDSKQ